MSSLLKNMDVVVLCGGMGTRLQSVLADRPKILAEFNGRPFLDILLKDLCYQGFRRVILATGYKAQMIEDYCQIHDFDCEIIFSKEDEPLGTGGALRGACNLIESETFFVFNGDSFCVLDLEDIAGKHLNHERLITMILSKVEDASDYGSVAVDNDGFILSFQEKVQSNPAVAQYAINAGVYVMDKKVFDLMPAQEKFSLERDYFAQLKQGEAFGYLTDATFIDIGTPERLKNAEGFFNNKD